MTYIAAWILLILGSSLLLLAWLAETWPNFQFIRRAEPGRCLIQSSEVMPRHEDTFCSRFRVTLCLPSRLAGTECEASYRLGNYGYSKGEAALEVATFSPGQEYDCWITAHPQQVTLSRKCRWWMTLTVGVVGVICLLVGLGLVTGGIAVAITQPQ